MQSNTNVMPGRPPEDYSCESSEGPPERHDTREAKIGTRRVPSLKHEKNARETLAKSSRISRAHPTHRTLFTEDTSRRVAKFRKNLYRSAELCIRSVVGRLKT